MHFSFSLLTSFPFSSSSSCFVRIVEIYFEFLWWSQLLCICVLLSDYCSYLWAAEVKEFVSAMNAHPSIIYSAQGCIEFAEDRKYIAVTDFILFPCKCSLIPCRNLCGSNPTDIKRWWYMHDNRHCLRSRVCFNEREGNRFISAQVSTIHISLFLFCIILMYITVTTIANRFYCCM